VYKLIVLLIACFSCFFSLTVAAQQSDPTRPFGANNAAVKKSKENQLVLQSIVDQGGEKNAIVSGKLLKLGDKIGQYRLDEINKNQVILISAEKRLTLPLFSNVVAKIK
jgi:hypothetical protein